jgi:Flp pilus assembly protein TadG
MSGDKLRMGCRKTERRRRGVTMVTVVLGLGALIGATALAIDVGAMWLAKTQLQNAADASALAAAANMIDLTGPSVTIPGAQSVAQQVGQANEAISADQVDVLTADVTFGNWDLDTRTFDTSVDLTDPVQVTAADVVTRMSTAANGPLPAFMSRILGFQDYDVVADATAYLGWAGRVAPPELVLPIAIDCCKLKGESCNGEYCPYIQANMPNPGPLDDPQDPDTGDVSVLEFGNTGDQNACWTQFSHHPSVNTNDITGIIQDGTQFDVAAGEKYYVDNGTKTPVIDDIYDGFHGEGFASGKPRGQDYYPPIHDPPVSDSWVTTLPVIECQDGIHCASGTEMEIKGFVCFEVREVVVTPDKIIRGTFMCPSHPRWDDCDAGPTGSGGLNFGIRADIPVLVR